MSNLYGNWIHDGVVHDLVDEEDEHRVLVARCGEKFGWVPYRFRKDEEQRVKNAGGDPDVVTCVRCIVEEVALG